MLGRQTPSTDSCSSLAHYQWKYCQMAICLTLQEAGPLITPTLILFSGYNQLLVENLMPRLVSWLLTWPIFLLTSELHAFSFCLVHGTHPFSGVCSAWILLPGRLTVLADSLPEPHPCRVAAASPLRHLN